MRPRGSTGEVRSAVVGAVRAEVGRLQSESAAPSAQPGVHLGRIAELAGTGRQATRRALDNACRAGELRIAGTCRMEHSKRPVALYDVAEALDDMPRASTWHEALMARVA
jgi:hypothetical protein